MDYHKLISDVRNRTEILLTNDECLKLCEIAEQQSVDIGEFAEVGVYKGGSALLLAELKGNKELYLFDTFEGIPYLNKDLDKEFTRGQFSSSYEDVSALFKGYPNIHIYKGLFEEQCLKIKEKEFAFVHIDVDVFWSALNALSFFYPRLSRGGKILLHDFPQKGVEEAILRVFESPLQVRLNNAQLSISRMKDLHTYFGKPIKDLMNVICRGVKSPEEFDSYGIHDASVVKEYIKEGDKILDFGCGIGRVLKHLPESAEGYDPDSDMRKGALEWCGRRILPDLSGKEEYYDMVFEILVLQHLSGDSRKEAFNNITRVLKKGGLFLSIYSPGMPEILDFPLEKIETKYNKYHKIVLFKKV